MGYTCCSPRFVALSVAVDMLKIRYEPEANEGGVAPAKVRLGGRDKTGVGERNPAQRVTPVQGRVTVPVFQQPAPHLIGCCLSPTLALVDVHPKQQHPPTVHSPAAHPLVGPTASLGP